MEFTIKKIISIDRDAENYKKNMEQLLVNKEKEFQKTIEDMRTDMEQKVIREKKEYMDMKINEAQKIASTIKSKKEEQIKKLNDMYSNEKESIIEEIFNEIVNISS